MNISIEVTGLGSLADSINNLADALRAGAKADEVIKTASRKAKKSEQVTAVETTPTVEFSEVKGSPEEIETASAYVKEHGKPAPIPPATEAEKPAEPEVVSASPSEPTADDAKKALLHLVREKGHPAGAEVLKQFGAAKISDIKPEDFPAFIDATSRALVL